MSEWRTASIGGLCSVIRAGGTPKADNPSFYGGPIPFVTIEDMTASGGRISSTKNTLTELGIANSAAWVVPPGFILFSMYGSMGKVARNEVAVATNQAILSMRPDESMILADFFAYALAYAAPSISRLAAQTTQANLSATTVKAATLHYPVSKDDQHRIASIITTADAAIAHTEALIAKTQQIKAGLMHDLFTRGVTPDGQLRPSREEAPDLYKETAIGWVPKEWEVGTVAGVSTLCVDCPHSTPVLSQDGLPMIRTSEIRDGEWREENAPRVSPAEYALRVSRAVPRPGDVVLTREAPVGEAFVIPPSTTPCLGQRMMLIRPESTKCLPQFLLYQLYSTRVQQNFARLVGGTTNPHLNVEEVRNFGLHLPDRPEQERIVHRLESVDGTLNAEQAMLQKFLAQRAGLMRDLLTAPTAG